jgi:hypothetical protein
MSTLLLVPRRSLCVCGSFVIELADAPPLNLAELIPRGPCPDCELLPAPRARRPPGVASALELRHWPPCPAKRRDWASCTCSPTCYAVIHRKYIRAGRLPVGWGPSELEALTEQSLPSLPAAPAAAETTTAAPARRNCPTCHGAGVIGEHLDAAELLYAVDPARRARPITLPQRQPGDALHRQHACPAAS